jgi:hypothetical protein
MGAYNDAKATLELRFLYARVVEASGEGRPRKAVHLFALMLFAAACGRVGFDHISADSAPDSVAVLGPFGEPTQLTPLSSAGDDLNPSLTSDLLELYFTRGLDVYVSIRAIASDTWGPPSRVAELSTSDADTDPEVAADGLTIYFSSNRPGGMGSMDIWVARRASRSAPWGPPVQVPELSSAADDYGPSADASGRVIVLSSSRAVPGTNALYVSERADAVQPWGEPTLIAELDGPDDDGTPHLIDGGRRVLFCSRRPAGSGKLDLYEAVRATLGDPFSPPVLLEELSTPEDECGPWMSADLRTLFFDRNRDTNGEIFQATR